MRSKMTLRERRSHAHFTADVNRLGDSMRDFHSMTCSDSELAEVERKLMVKRFRLVAKTDQKELLPNEYMKSPHRGTSQSFEGPRTWTITSCI